MTSAKRKRRGTPANVEIRDAGIVDSRLRLFGVLLLCLYVAFVPVVFDPLQDFAFTVPKALLSHSLIYVLSGVIVGLLIQFGRSTLPWSWLHVPVAAFLLVNVFASVTAADRQLAVFGDHSRMLGLNTIAAWTVLYFAVVVLVRTPADLRQLIVAGLIGVSVMLGYEVIQLLRLDPIRWEGDATVRPISTNGQATTLAAYLTVLAMLASTIAVTLRERPSRQLALWLVLAAALLAGAAATGTRSIVFGLVTGGGVLLVLVFLRSKSRRERTAILIGAGATAALLAGLLTLTPIGARLLQTSSPPGSSVAGTSNSLDLASLDVRAVLYGVAIDALRERPLLGYGPDNFVVAMSRHRPEQGPEEARLSYATSAHSWVGQVAVGSGLLGLMAFLAIAGTAVALAVRGRSIAAVCVGAVAMATYLGTGLTTVSDVASDWIFWVGAALIAGSGATAPVASANATPAADARRTRSRRQPRQWQLSSVLPVAVGVVIALMTITAMQASRAAKTSEDARLIGAAGAVEAGVAATSLDPGRAEYWHDLGLAYVSTTRWRDAASAFERAVRLAPWDPRNIGDLLQTQEVLAHNGDNTARARVPQLADQVVAADPNHPDAQFTRAVAMQFIGDYAEALRSVERALTLAPNAQVGQWYVTAGQIYVALGRPADAVDVTRRGLTIVNAPASALPIRIELARDLLANGQPREALQEIDAVLATDPRNATAQQVRLQIQAALAQ